MKHEGCQIIVFAKAPEPGHVKTRLIPTLGPVGAALLYERMAWRCLLTAAGTGIGPIELWCVPGTDHPFFRRCAEEFGLQLYAQPDGDLGDRMGYALQVTLQRSRFALLIGTDCPSRTGEDLQKALFFLREGAQAVIGPSEDGGYVLIGLSEYSPALFSEIPWGTQGVLELTRARLRTSGWRWQELSQRWDVDRPEDVERLWKEGYGDLFPSRSSDFHKIGKENKEDGTP